MSVFKGTELETMNKSDIIDMMKDLVFHYRVKGGITKFCKRIIRNRYESS